MASVRVSNFRLFVGGLPATAKVKLKIFKKIRGGPKIEAEEKSIELSKKLKDGDKRVWEVNNVTLPEVTDGQTLVYRYSVKLPRTKVVDNREKLVENDYRSVGRVCTHRDIFRKMNILPRDNNLARSSFLQEIFEDASNLKFEDSLNELDQPDLFHRELKDSDEWVKLLGEWLDKKFRVTTDDQRLLLLGLIWSKLSTLLDRDVSELQFDDEVLQRVLKGGYLNTAKISPVVTDALHYLSIALVKLSGKAHWIFLAIKFPQIFDLVDICESKKKMNSDPSDVPKDAMQELNAVYKNNPAKLEEVKRELSCVATDPNEEDEASLSQVMEDCSPGDSGHQLTSTTVKFRLVTNYTTIENIEVVLVRSAVSKDKKHAVLKKTSGTLTREIEASTDETHSGQEESFTKSLKLYDQKTTGLSHWRVASAEVTFQQNKEEKIAFFFRVTRLQKPPHDTKTKRLKEGVKRITGNCVDKTEETRITSRLIHIDLDIFEEEADPHKDDVIKKNIDYVRKRINLKTQKCITKWVDRRLDAGQTLSSTKLLFIILAMQTMIPTPETDKKNRTEQGSAMVLLDVLRSQQVVWSLKKDFSQWLLACSECSWLQALCYLHHHLPAKDMCTLADKLEPSFIINARNWNECEKVLSNIVPSAKEKILKYIARKIKSPEAFVNFIKLCERSGFLGDKTSTTWGKIEKTFHGVMEEDSSKKNPDHIADLLEQAENITFYPIAETLIKHARSIVFDKSLVWNDLDATGVLRLTMVPEIYRDINRDVPICLNYFLNGIRQKGLKHKDFLAFLLTEQFNTAFFSDDATDASGVFVTFISLLQNASLPQDEFSRSDFLYFYEFATIHNQCEDFPSELIDKCNAKLYTVEIKMEHLVSCFAGDRYDSPAIDLSIVTRHIIARIDDTKDTTEDKIQQCHDVFNKLDAGNADLSQKELIGKKALDLIGDMEIDVLRTKRLSKVSQRCFEAILGTKWSWEMVFKTYELDMFLKHPPLKALIETLDTIRSCLERGKCTYDFMRFMIQRQDDFRDLFRALEGKRMAVVAEWTKALEAAISMIENCQRRREYMEEILAFIEQVMHFGHIHSVDPAKAKLTDLAKRTSAESTFDICDDAVELFWQDHELILQVAQIASKYRNSVIFFNICSHEFSAVGIFSSLDHIAVKLKKTCLPMYEELRQSLFASVSTLKMSAITNYLEGVDSIEKLEMEFDFLRIKDIPLPSKVALRNYLRYLQLKPNLNKLHEILITFDLLDPRDDMLSALKLLTELKEKSHCTLEEVDNAMTHIDFLQFVNDDWVILDQLQHCEDLVRFLHPLMEGDEDLRNLVEVIEDHEEESVHVGIVSDLIDVTNLFRSLLQVKGSDRVKQFAQVIRDHRSLAKRLSKKIGDCKSNMTALLELHSRMANRGERRREIILATLEKSKFTFALRKDETYSAEMELFGDIQRTYDIEELQDLKSKALFAVNSKRAQRENDLSLDRSHYEDFIEIISVAVEIVEVLNQLYSDGHFSYVVGKILEETHQGKGSKSLNNLLNDLNNQHSTWISNVESKRLEYYHLNFFSSNQLWILDKLFHEELEEPTGTTIDQVLARANASFMQTLGESDIARPSNSSQDHQEESLTKRLSDIGDYMKKFVSIPKATTESRSLQILGHEHSVQHGKVCVIDREQFTRPLSVLLQIYKHTYGSIPQLSPWQVLFCHQDTTLEDVTLLLQRCEGASHNGLSDVLFTLVNVDLLPHGIQFDVIKKVESLIEEKEPFLLAIIGAGGVSNPVVCHFYPENVSTISGLSDDELTLWLRAHCPEFEVVTSDVPGLGKTEYIKNKAAERDVVKISVSGPISRNGLVKHFSEHYLDDNALLHIDLGMVSHPDLFDNFMLELAVLGTVSYGIYVFCLRTKFVRLEIANTVGNKLQHLITSYKLFENRNISWDDFESYIVCKERQSPVQVVSQYLQAKMKRSLDKIDISLEERSPIEERECRKLLRKEFQGIPQNTMSFTKVETYLNVFAGELRKLSASSFFTVRYIREESHVCEENARNLRSQLVHAISEMSKTFGSHMNRQGDQSSLTDTSDITSMVARTQQIVRWEDSEHIYLVFNSQDTQTVSLVYRLVSRVPQSITQLWETQLYRSLDDYNEMPESKLHGVLEKVCRTRKTSTDISGQHYVLTPDNLLKMILIYKRIKARIPVVIMGHTGCGKTMLIRYLARVCDVSFPRGSFHTLNVHAGTSLETITQFIDDRKKDAKRLKRKGGNCVWVFFDEINTSKHLDILCDILVNNTFQGEYLPTNLVFLAACNPYDFRKSSSHLTTGGLKQKNQSNVSDDKSQLVYRVEPLPERVLQYVWDFGALSKRDEEMYITRMLRVEEVPFDDDSGEESTCSSLYGPLNKEIVVLQNLQEIFASVVFKSQEFIRTVEDTEYCVSLRDVSRCKYLALFFIEWLLKKGLATLDNEGNEKDEKEREQELVVRSIILALTHCYHSRLQVIADRKKYVDMIGSVVKQRYTYVTTTYVGAVIEAETIDILRQMELPPGTAMNSALKENVFIILVSILARIPVFVVGNPGCSKSLSLQLIRSNLKGPNSKSIFFKQLPRVFMMSYQGSEKSTSEGIQQIFDKAERQLKKHADYRRSSKKSHLESTLQSGHMIDGTDVLPVVLLDEVGLAEISPHNPLKVLHSLLEKSSKVPVVGLSNWALDAAKMNRAVYLSRPELTTDDLFQTAKAIRDISGDPNAKKILADPQMKTLADAYSQYTKNQKIPNFHGLRDYYALVKYISITDSQMDDTRLNDTFSDRLINGLLRNFGGIDEKETDRMITLFSMSTNIEVVKQSESDQKVSKRITNNLVDYMARHLLIVMNGNSLLTFLEEELQTMKDREYHVIFGSKFEADNCEEYYYQILSDIILYMEKGVTIVLKDLESIYGSLYDMLNQNYTMMGGKRHCRIAHGPYKSPLCEVHDNFRCVVIIDELKLSISDPPFLNRFEKQMLKFEDLLTPDQMSVARQLEKWISGLQSQKSETGEDTVRDAQNVDVARQQVRDKDDTSPTTVQQPPSSLESKEDLPDLSRQDDTAFDPGEMFFGFNNANLASVVYFLGKTIPTDELLQQCKNEILPTACPSAILRSSKSMLATDSQNVDIARHETRDEDATNPETVKPPPSNVESEEDSPKNKPNEVVELMKSYFDLDIHDGIVDFLRPKLVEGTHETDDKELHCIPCPSMTIIYTLSSAHNDLSTKLEDTILESLRIFKRVHDFSKRMREFWFKSEAKLLILQCIPMRDENKMHMARYLLDKYKTEYLNTTSEANRRPKHVCILVHMNRPKPEDGEQVWQYGFLPGWTQVTIESLFPTKRSIRDIRETPLSKIIKDLEEGEFQTHIKDEVKWCLSCLKYRTGQRDAKSCLELERRISKGLCNLIKPQVIRAATEREEIRSDTWVVEVACNKRLLHTYTTLDNAVKESERHCIRSALGKVIYFMENNSAWSGMESDDEDTFAFWGHCFQSIGIFDICSTSIPELKGPNSCMVEKARCNVKFPFFMVFHEKIQECKGWWREEKRKLQRDISSNTTDMAQTLTEKIRLEAGETDMAQTLTEKIRMEAGETDMAQTLTKKIRMEAGEIEHDGYLNKNLDVFVDDVYRVFAVDHHLCADTEDNLKIVKWYFENKFPHTSRDECTLQTVASLYMTLWANEEQVATEELQLLLMYKRFSNNPNAMLETMERQVKNEKVKDQHDHEVSVFTDVFKYVVQAICKLVLPTEDVLKSVGGVQAWQESVALVIHFAAKFKDTYDIQPVEFRFLQFCRDFVSILSPHFAISVQSVSRLATLGSHLNETDSLTGEVFVVIQDQISKMMPTTVKEEKYQAIEDFFSVYFTRAFEANPDDFGIEKVRDFLFKKRDGKPTLGAARVLHGIINTDVSEYDPPDKAESTVSLGDLIIKSNSILDDDGYPNLKMLDKDLKKLPRPDDHMAVICCDLIEKIVFSNVTAKRIQEITTADDQVLVTLNNAVHVICTSTQCSMQLIFSIAFAWVFFKALSDMDFGALVDLRKTNSSLVKELNETMGDQRYAESRGFGKNRIGSLRVCLLQSLRRRMTKSKVKQVLESLSWRTGVSECGYGFIPMKYVNYYSEVCEAVAEWPVPDGSSSKLRTIQSKVNHQSQYMLALSAVLIDRFFLVKCSRPLKDAENEVAKLLMRFVKNSNNFSLEYRAFIEYVLSAADTLVDKERKSHQLSVFMHLASIFVSQKNREMCSGSFSKCLFPKGDTSRLLLPASGVPRNVLRDDSIVASSCVVVKCPSCQYIISIEHVESQKCDDKSHCPVCSQNLEPNSFEIQPHTCTPAVTKPVYQKRTCSDVMPIGLTIRDLTPVTYRVLNILVHGCFHMALVMNEASTECLQFLLDTDTIVNSDNIKTLMDNYLWKQIDNDWDVLIKLLEYGSEQTAAFLHKVIMQASTDSNSIKSVPFDKAFESNISQVVNKVLKAIRESGTLMKDEQRSRKTEELTLEQQMEELYCSSEHTSPSALPRLFRNKGTSSFHSLEVSVVSNLNTLKKHHGFLCLFMSTKEQLECLGHILPLLDWHIFITDMLNRQIDRNEANVPIKTFFQKKSLASSTGSLDTYPNVFEEFQKSWNFVRGKWKLLTGEHPTFGEMDEEQKLSACLAEDSQNPGLLQSMVKVLVDIQNDFLKKALHIAASGKCSALSFVMKGERVGVLPTVPLIEGRTRIITFKWLDTYLRHSHADTGYGRCDIIHYNYSGLERHLCEDLVLNKACLRLEDTFSKFSYKRELYNAFGGIREIDSYIHQEKLPPAIVDSVRSINDPNEIEKVMKQLHIVTSFLKLISREELRSEERGKELLIEYMKSDDPGPDLTPEECLVKSCASVKLCHIEDLYEELEQTVADVVVSTLPPQFRKTLDNEETVSQLDAKFVMTGLKQLELIVAVVKKFVYRYLGQDDIPGAGRVDIPEKVHSSLKGVIQHRAKEIFLKVEDVDAVEFLFPDVKLCHMVDIVKTLQAELDVKKKDKKTTEDLPIQSNKPRRKRAAKM